MISEEEKYELAQRRVKKMKKFYKNLSTWMFTCIFLAILFFFLRMPPWITFVVVAGWGIGIAAEAVDIFGFPGIDRDWEERKIREEMEKMGGRSRRTRKPAAHDDDDLDLEERLDLPDYREVRKNWDESDLV